MPNVPLLYCPAKIMFLKEITAGNIHQMIVIGTNIHFACSDGIKYYDPGTKTLTAYSGSYLTRCITYSSGAYISNTVVPPQLKGSVRKTPGTWTEVKNVELTDAVIGRSMTATAALSLYSQESASIDSFYVLDHTNSNQFRILNQYILSSIILIDPDDGTIWVFGWNTGTNKDFLVNAALGSIIYVTTGLAEPPEPCYTEGSNAREMHKLDGEIFIGSAGSGAGYTGVMKYNISGDTWSLYDLGVNIHRTVLYNGKCYALATGKMFRYDGGSTWTEINLNNPTTQFNCGIEYDGKLYIGSYDGNLYVYED